MTLFHQPIKYFVLTSCNGNFDDSIFNRYSEESLKYFNFGVMGIINGNALTFSHFQGSVDKSHKNIVQYATFLIMQPSS